MKNSDSKAQQQVTDQFGYSSSQVWPALMHVHVVD